MHSRAFTMTALCCLLTLQACNNDSDVDTAPAPIDFEDSEIDPAIKDRSSIDAHNKPGGSYFEKQVSMHGPPPWERDDGGESLDRYDLTLASRSGEVFMHGSVWIESLPDGNSIGWRQLSPPRGMNADQFKEALNNSKRDPLDTSDYFPPLGKGICSVVIDSESGVVYIDLTPPTGYDKDWNVVIPTAEDDETPIWSYDNVAGSVLAGPVSIQRRPS